MPVATRLLVRRLTEDSERVLKCQTPAWNCIFSVGRSVVFRTQLIRGKHTRIGVKKTKRKDRALTPTLCRFDYAPSICYL